MILPAEAMRLRLMADSAIVALIGDRLLPSAGTMLTVKPFVVFSLLAADHHHHLLNASGLNQARVQFDIFASEYATAKAISELFRLRLDGWRGTVTNGSDSVLLSCVELRDERDDYVPPTDGSDAGTYRLMHDYFVSASESIPAHT